MSDSLGNTSYHRSKMGLMWTFRLRRQKTSQSNIKEICWEGYERKSEPQK